MLRSVQRLIPGASYAKPKIGPASRTLPPDTPGTATSRNGISDIDHHDVHESIKVSHPVRVQGSSVLSRHGRHKAAVTDEPIRDSRLSHPRIDSQDLRESSTATVGRQVARNTLPDSQRHDLSLGSDDEDSATPPTHAYPRKRRKHTANALQRRRSRSEEDSEFEAAEYASDGFTEHSEVNPQSQRMAQSTIARGCRDGLTPVNGQRIHPVNHPNVVWFRTKWLAIECHLCHRNAVRKSMSEPPAFFKGPEGLLNHNVQVHNNEPGAPWTKEKVLQYCGKQTIDPDMVDRMKAGKEFPDLVLMNSGQDSSEEPRASSGDHHVHAAVKYKCGSSDPKRADSIRQAPDALAERYATAYSGPLESQLSSDGITALLAGIGPAGGAASGRRVTRDASGYRGDHQKMDD